MATTVQTDPREIARHQREPYPLPPALRAQLIKVTLAICGLQIHEDGQVTNNTPAEGKRKTSARDTIAAMRIMTSFERNTLAEKRVEQAMEARGIYEEEVPVVDILPPITSEIADQALIMLEEETKKKKEAQALEPEPDWRQPIAPPAPEEDDPRWPITKLIREAILLCALDLCGLKATPEGTFEPSGQRPAKPRIRLGALRVLASLDLLAIQQKRVKYLGVTSQLREKRRHKVMVDQEIARKVHAFIHDERVKLRDRIEAGDVEALAEANKSAAYYRKQASWKWN